MHTCSCHSYLFMSTSSCHSYCSCQSLLLLNRHPGSLTHDCHCMIIALCSSSPLIQALQLAFASSCYHLVSTPNQHSSVSGFCTTISSLKSSLISRLILVYLSASVVDSLYYIYLSLSDKKKPPSLSSKKKKKTFHKHRPHH
jgi:hypothetical protein